MIHFHKQGQEKLKIPNMKPLQCNKTSMNKPNIIFKKKVKQTL
jgi:hypothetical protein